MVKTGHLSSPVPPSFMFLEIFHQLAAHCAPWLPWIPQKTTRHTWHLASLLISATKISSWANIRLGGALHLEVQYSIRIISTVDDKYDYKSFLSFPFKSLPKSHSKLRQFSSHVSWHEKAFIQRRVHLYQFLRDPDMKTCQ